MKTKSPERTYNMVNEQKASSLNSGTTGAPTVLIKKSTGQIVTAEYIEGRNGGPGRVEYTGDDGRRYEKTMLARQAISDQTQEALAAELAGHELRSDTEESREWAGNDNPCLKYANRHRLGLSKEELILVPAGKYGLENPIRGWNFGDEGTVILMPIEQDDGSSREGMAIGMTENSVFDPESGRAELVPAYVVVVGEKVPEVRIVDAAKQNTFLRNLRNNKRNSR